MKVYFRSKKAINKIEDWDEISLQHAPKEIVLYPYIFKLHMIKSLDNGLLYDCINEDVEACTDCYGKGHTKCQECDGMGTINCDSCDGQGYFEPDEIKRKKKKEKEEKLKMEEFMKNQISMDELWA